MAHPKAFFYHRPCYLSLILANRTIFFSHQAIHPKFGKKNNMERRYDLDWLRVIAFALLIFYHIGMFFVPWDWHVKNNITYPWLEYPMTFLNRWRMPLLFVISGMGIAFSLGRRSAGKFAAERIIRLFIPLIFGILVVIPPQVYIEQLVSGQFVGSYLDFWPTEAITGANWNWNHLWFIPYILVYSLVLLPICLYIKKNPENAFIRFIDKLAQSKWGLYWLIVPLFLMEGFLDPFSPITHGLINDWYNFLYNLTLFFYGFMFIMVGKSFFATVVRYRKAYLVSGIINFAIFMFLIKTFEDGWQRHFSEAAVNQINMWSWLLAVFGLAAAFMNKKNKLIVYCNTAVYPFYILHQTVIVVYAYFLVDTKWNLFSKFTVLTLGTFATCWILYEFLIRRVAILGFVMGLKYKKDKQE